METVKQPRLSIVLAEDDKEHRYFFEKALKQLPVAHQLSTVPDGERLVDYLVKNRLTLPDVIFLDLGMPGKNGWQCLADIVAHKKWKSIPVVIYSATCNDDIADMLYSGGAFYYLQKCDMPQLVLLLQYVLAQVGQKAGRPGREEFVLHLQSSILPADIEE